EPGRDLRSRAERVLPRIGRIGRYGGAVRRGHLEEADEGSKVTRACPRRQCLVRLVGEEDEAVAPSATGERRQRRADSGVRGGRDAGGDVQDDDRGRGWGKRADRLGV